MAWRWKRRERNEGRPQGHDARDMASAKLISAQNELLQLYFVRHGGTARSLSGQHTGRTDVRLTAEGEDQGRQLRPWLQTIPFTHVLLSQYVGTSREIVTHYMNQFRRQGYLRYSRKGILLHRDALKEWLRQEPLAA